MVKPVRRDATRDYSHSRVHCSIGPLHLQPSISRRCIATTPSVEMYSGFLDVRSYEPLTSSGTKRSNHNYLLSITSSRQDITTSVMRMYRTGRISDRKMLLAGYDGRGRVKAADGSEAAGESRVPEAVVIARTSRTTAIKLALRPE